MARDENPALEMKSKTERRGDGVPEGHHLPQTRNSCHPLRFVQSYHTSYKFLQLCYPLLFRLQDESQFFLKKTSEIERLNVSHQIYSFRGRSTEMLLHFRNIFEDQSITINIKACSWPTTQSDQASLNRILIS